MKAYLRMSPLGGMIDIKEKLPELSLPCPAIFPTPFLHKSNDQYLGDETMPKRMVFTWKSSWPLDGEEVQIYDFKEVVS